MIEIEGQWTKDMLVQGSVAIASGIIIFGALFLPWLSTNSAISGLTHVEGPAQVAIPMTLILLAILIIFGGIMHIAGYRVGIQLATAASALAFFISVMVIVVTLANIENFEGKTLNVLMGPWIGAAGAIFGAISQKLERK